MSFGPSKREPMASRDLHEQLHKYKAAYTAYMQSVHALSDAGKAGIWPSAEVLEIEEQSLNELLRVRQELLDTLFAYSVKARH
jgi:hypothetical protein